MGEDAELLCLVDTFAKDSFVYNFENVNIDKIFVNSFLKNKVWCYSNEHHCIHCLSLMYVNENISVQSLTTMNIPDNHLPELNNYRVCEECQFDITMRNNYEFYIFRRFMVYLFIHNYDLFSETIQDINRFMTVDYYLNSSGIVVKYPESTIIIKSGRMLTIFVIQYVIDYFLYTFRGVNDPRFDVLKLAKKFQCSMSRILLNNISYDIDVVRKIVRFYNPDLNSEDNNGITIISKLINEVIKTPHLCEIQLRKCPRYSWNFHKHRSILDFLIRSGALLSHKSVMTIIFNNEFNEHSLQILFTIIYDYNVEISNILIRDYRRGIADKFDINSWRSGKLKQDAYYKHRYIEIFNTEFYQKFIEVYPKKTFTYFKSNS